jgi:NADH-quinone oxidoreductase subunit M
MPGFSGFFLFFGMASLGLPGLNNFVGEFLVLIGSMKAWPLVTWFGFAGLVFTVIYVLTVVQKTVFEETRSEKLKEQVLADITAREAFILTPLAVAVLLIGLHPQPVLDLFAGPVGALTGFLK